MSTVHTTGKQVNNHLSVSHEERIVMATRMSRHMQLSTGTGTGHGAGWRVRELKGLKEGFAPGMSLSEDEGSGRSHRRTRSEYRREPPGGFSGMIMAAISGMKHIGTKARNKSNLGNSAPGERSKVSEVPITSDVGCSKIKVSEAPGSLQGGTASGRRLRSHGCRARLPGRDPKIKGSKAPGKSSGERDSLNPTGHMISMERLLHYLAGTVDWKLQIGGHDDGPKDESIHMYADFDYAC
jgi:hypothetical protein